ncbi:hypothetical protein [Clostridium tagluense]|uniref:hypothetical protein n=1 Tax=Clostridium tagluense TaxID=360422 RepID=UPI001C6EB58E|nr:hypothetical protein [Clostridium tagluense]MBW9159311.1 hypothetical protein [Clostridium tagluense]
MEMRGQSPKVQINLWMQGRSSKVINDGGHGMRNNILIIDDDIELCQLLEKCVE